MSPCKEGHACLWKEHSALLGTLSLEGWHQKAFPIAFIRCLQALIRWCCLLLALSIGLLKLSLLDDVSTWLDAGWLCDPSLYLLSITCYFTSAKQAHSFKMENMATVDHSWDCTERHSSEEIHWVRMTMEFLTLKCTSLYSLFFITMDYHIN